MTNTDPHAMIRLSRGEIRRLIRQTRTELSSHDIDEIPAESLDVIIAADVMEHLDEPADWARRFAGILKPAGRLIVSGPSENALYKLGRWVAGFGGKGEYHHTNIAALVEDIRSVGFKPLRRRKLPFGLLPTLFEYIEFRRPDTLRQAETS